MRKRRVFDLVKTGNYFLLCVTLSEFLLSVKVSDVTGYLVFPRTTFISVRVLSSGNVSTKSYIRQFRLFKSRYGYYILFKSIRYYFPDDVVSPLAKI